MSIDRNRVKTAVKAIWRDFLLGEGFEILACCDIDERIGSLVDLAQGDHVFNFQCIAEKYLVPAGISVPKIPSGPDLRDTDPVVSTTEEEDLQLEEFIEEWTAVSRDVERQLKNFLVYMLDRTKF
jgi:hypothetical protein